MKKLPKSVTVFGRIIPIHNLSSDKIKELYPDFQQAAPLGLWDSSRRVIIINKDFPVIDQAYTLKHEMGHAMMTFIGLDLIIDPSLQEVLVQSMATLMEDVLNQARSLK